MCGSEVSKKLKDAGYVLADVARLLGVAPQSLNQSLNAKDVKSGFLEELCRVLNKDVGFFYGSTIEKTNTEPQQNQSVPYFMYRDLQNRLEASIRENQSLREKLAKYDDDAVGKQVV